MKTLNLNKILLLISLFLISAVFSTAAEASCRYTDAGLLDVAVDGDGNSDAPVYETSRSARGDQCKDCLLYTSPSPRDQRGSRMPSSA